jgi:catechol 2,3-dioxygenase-like lactoylglutathione lyase family enzyme
MESRALLKSVAPQLVVEDVVATAEYYRDVLGFEINGYWAQPPVYAIVSRGGVEIHFGRAEQNGMSNSAVRSGSFDLYIWVDDIERLYGELEEAGANIVEGPVKRVYESTEVVVKDLNEYLLVFAT